MASADRAAKRCTDTVPVVDIRTLERETALVGGEVRALAWRTARGLVALRWWISGEYVALLPGDLVGPVLPDAVTWVPLVRSRCEVRAVRRWFACPACGARVATLYIDDAIACRTCLGLVYRSQREGPRARAAAELERLRARLGWPPLPWLSIGERPAGMHRVTFERLLARHVTLAARAGFSGATLPVASAANARPSG